MVAAPITLVLTSFMASGAAAAGRECAPAAPAFELGDASSCTSLALNNVAANADLVAKLARDTISAPLGQGLRPRLRSVQLSGAGLNSTGLQHLLAAGLLGPKSRLTDLTLSSNVIDDEGAKALGEALKTNTRLRYLDLQGNRITAKGAAALLAGLTPNLALRVLLLLSPSQLPEWIAATPDLAPLELYTPPTSGKEVAHTAKSSTGMDTDALIGGSDSFRSSLRLTSSLARMVGGSILGGRGFGSSPGIGPR